LIIGGTGFLGRNFLKYLLENDADYIRIFSRDEHKQEKMISEMFSVSSDYVEFIDRVRFIIGDVRDRDALFYACKDIDYVFHFAALKVVPLLEYAPWEAVQTNIIGTKNVIDACVFNKVRRAVFVSTDKAVEPFNLYGMCKGVAEKLWLNANVYLPIFCCCRYGNVFNSTSSVTRKWLAFKKIKYTDPEMTRFFIDIKHAIETIIKSLFIYGPSCILIPKMKAYKLSDLIDAFKSVFGFDLEKIPVRPGEKKHEVIISKNELPIVSETDFGFVLERFISTYISQPSILHKEYICSRTAPKLKKSELVKICKKLKQ